MRVLADENVPGPFVRGLRERGHDVSWIATDAVGTHDPEVASIAQTQARVLVTLDKDFGELVFRERLFGESGVLLLRAKGRADVRFAALIAALEGQGDWTNRFVVVENQRVRVRLRSST